mmetsp:Transcript_41212/g.93186  ORF Transcript_41212/g.93186 Transcript_41212/m.93186 type:complete len:256 (+) Transcript_41212:83-850(+)
MRPAQQSQPSLRASRRLQWSQYPRCHYSKFCVLAFRIRFPLGLARDKNCSLYFAAPLYSESSRSPANALINVLTTPPGRWVSIAGRQKIMCRVIASDCGRATQCISPNTLLSTCGIRVPEGGTRACSSGPSFQVDQLRCGTSMFSSDNRASLASARARARAPASAELSRGLAGDRRGLDRGCPAVGACCNQGLAGATFRAGRTPVHSWVKISGSGRVMAVAEKGFLVNRSSVPSNRGLEPSTGRSSTSMSSSALR